MSTMTLEETETTKDESLDSKKADPKKVKKRVEEKVEKRRADKKPASPITSSNGEKLVASITEESLLLDQRLRGLVRHITHVQQSCSLLGERLIIEGEREIGHKLISNGFIHDHSKFHGIEWLYLHDDVLASQPELFKAALIQHTSSNPHHPEYWHEIEHMPRVYVAEMVCDWHARSGEFGADLRTFIKERATKKFGFSTSGRVYKEIKGLVDLLLDPAFV